MTEKTGAARAESVWQRTRLTNVYGRRAGTTRLGPNTRRDAGRVAVFANIAGTVKVCG